MAKGFGAVQQKKKKPKNRRRWVIPQESTRFPTLEKTSNIADTSEVENWVAELLEFAILYDVDNGDMPLSMGENTIIISVCEDRHTLLKALSVMLSNNCDEFNDIQIWVKTHSRSAVKDGQDNSKLAMGSVSSADSSFWMMAQNSSYTMIETEKYKSVMGVDCHERDFLGGDDELADIEEEFFDIFGCCLFSFDYE